MIDEESFELERIITKKRVAAAGEDRLQKGSWVERRKMSELKEITYERYCEVMDESKRKREIYLLLLSANQVWVLHQALRLVITHPMVLAMKNVVKENQEIIKLLYRHLRNMGFTEEEILYLDSAFTGREGSRRVLTEEELEELGR